jgi:hypothetical protein
MTIQMNEFRGIGIRDTWKLEPFLIPNQIPKPLNPCLWHIQAKIHNVKLGPNEYFLKPNPWWAFFPTL